MKFELPEPAILRSTFTYQASSDKGYPEGSIKLETVGAAEPVMILFIRRSVDRQLRQRRDDALERRGCSGVGSGEVLPFYPEGFKGFAHYSLLSAMQGLSVAHFPFIATITTGAEKMVLAGYEDEMTIAYDVESFRVERGLFSWFQKSRLTACRQAREQIRRFNRAYLAYRDSEGLDEFPRCQ